MKIILVLCSIVCLVYGRNILGNQLGLKNHHKYGHGLKRCVNMWDEGCINGQLGGSGNDDYYLGGSFNPGKRCVNMWDEGCVNGQLGGSGRTGTFTRQESTSASQEETTAEKKRRKKLSSSDDYYLNGGFNPGKRCVNMWDEGCINGQLGGSGGDDYYLNGGFNPGRF